MFFENCKLSNFISLLLGLLDSMCTPVMCTSIKQLLQSLDNNNDCCSGFSFATNSCFLPVDTRREEQLKEMECMLMISQWSQTKNSFKSVLRQNMSAVPQRIFPPSEAQFPKVQTSIYKAFKNAAIVTGLVSYILTLFSLDILSTNIFFFFRTVKGCQQKVRFALWIIVYAVQK